MISATPILQGSIKSGEHCGQASLALSKSGRPAWRGRSWPIQRCPARPVAASRPARPPPKPNRQSLTSLPPGPGGISLLPRRPRLFHLDVPAPVVGLPRPPVNRSQQQAHPRSQGPHLARPSGQLRLAHDRLCAGGHPGFRRQRRRPGRDFRHSSPLASTTIALACLLVLARFFLWIPLLHAA